MRVFCYNEFFMVLEWFRCFEVGRESGFVVNEVVFRRENIGGKEVV